MTLPYCPNCGGEADCLPIHPGWFGCVECKCQWEESKRYPAFVWQSEEERAMWQETTNRLTAQYHDAERYRWIRTRQTEIIINSPVSAERSESLDAAIDAAMAKDSEELDRAGRK